MKFRFRSGYLGAHFAMIGPVLAVAFLQRNMIPTVIWLAVTVVIVAFGKER